MLLMGNIIVAQNISIEAAYLPGGYNIKYIQPIPASSGNNTFETMFKYGAFLTNIEVSVDILKHFEIYGNQKLYMESSGAFMKPTQAEWNIGLALKLNKKFKIGYEHLCIHPLKTDNYQRIELYGGYNKLYLRFNAKMW